MTTSCGRDVTLNEGAATGQAVVLTERLSFMGGVDPNSGCIVDPHHPELGRCLRDAVLYLPGTRGSSGTSAVLLECVRQGTAPAAVILASDSPILLVGVLVARELYGVHLPVVLAGPATAIPADGTHVSVVAREDNAEITLL